MTSLHKLKKAINAKKNCLCIGLDTEISKVPLEFAHYSDPVLAFNQRIIEITSDLVVAYKINTAFYEANGAAGWVTMQKTLESIPKDIFTIADAKRGDIGNTAEQYAKAFFSNLDFDSVTLSPYMGLDSLTPYLAYEDKVIIPLALTSNHGANDFQKLVLHNGNNLYMNVLTTIASLEKPDQIMFVVGATRTDALQKVRQLVPNHFLLVPGVGTQGGTVDEVMGSASNDECGLLINVSRGIIFNNETGNLNLDIRSAAEMYAGQMKRYIK